MYINMYIIFLNNILELFICVVCYWCNYRTVMRAYNKIGDTT